MKQLSAEFPPDHLLAISIRVDTGEVLSCVGPHGVVCHPPPAVVFNL